MSLSSYLFERHQALTHHMSQRLATWRAGARRRQARRPAICDVLEPRVLMSVAPVTFTDASGDTVTVTLTGPGSMSVIRLGQGDAQGITLSGTTASTTLKVTVTNPDKKVVPSTTLESIDLGTGQLGTLLAGNVDLVGAGILCSTISTSSYIKSITIRDLQNGADIDLDNNTLNTISTKLTARVVGDGSDILLNNAISAATFANVGDNAITATKIGTLKVTGIKGDATYVGNFDSTLTLTANKGTVLGSATIAGHVTNTAWFISGSVGSLTLGGALNGSNFTISGSLGPVKAAEIENDLWNIAGRVSKVTTAGDFTGTYGTIGFGTISVGGDFHGTLHLGSSTTSDSTSVLSSMAVKGSIIGGINATHGSIGTVSGASMTGLTLAITNGLISKISSSGAMANSTITARRIGTWSVGGNLSDTTATISGTGLSGYAVLSSLTVTGDVTATYIKAALGGVGTVKVNSLTNSTLEFPDGRISTLKVNADVSKGYVQGLTTLGTISAQSIGAWTVGGNLADANVTLGSYSKTSGKQALDSLAVTGTISGTSITADFGGAGTISGYAITTSQLHFADGRIGTLKSTTLHSGGTVEAMTIGTWKVGTTLNEIDATLATKSKVHGLYALTDLIVGGDIVDSSVIANYGAVRTISANSMSSAVIKFADGRIETIKSTLNQDGGSVDAMSIGTWKVGGDLKDVKSTLATSSSMHNYYTIVSLSVTGVISGVDIQAQYGGVRSISAKAINSTSSKIYFADGYISSITTTMGIEELDLKAESIGTWTAGGSLDGVTVALGNATTKGYLALENLNVNGDLIDTSIVASEGGAGSIVVKNVSGGKIYFTNGRISLLDVSGNMETTDNVNDQVRAYSIGRWYVDGYLKKSVVTVGTNDNKENLALGTLIVGGAMTDVKITGAYDQAGTIQADSISGGSLAFGGSVAKISVNLSMSDTAVLARRVDTWLVGSNLSAVDATLGDSTTRRTGNMLTNVIDVLDVGGTIDSCTLIVDGSLGSVTADKMVFSNLYVGFYNNGGGYAKRSDEDILSLTITGDGSKTPAFSNNTISSFTVSNMAVNYPTASTITSEMIFKLGVTQYTGGVASTATWSNLSSTPTDPTGKLNGLSFSWL